jgi:hypothetical protein
VCLSVEKADGLHRGQIIVCEEENLIVDFTGHLHALLKRASFTDKSFIAQLHVT